MAGAGSVVQYHNVAAGEAVSAGFFCGGEDGFTFGRGGKDVGHVKIILGGKMRDKGGFATPQNKFPSIQLIAKRLFFC